MTGISVSEYSALHYSPVWSGVSTLSRDIAKLPLVFYRNLPNGGKERFTTHRLYRILHDEPNPDMTSFKWRETMQALCVLYGNSYSEIVRDDMGRPAGLYPILPSRVTVFRTDTGLLRYRVSNPNGGQTILQPRNIIHLSALSMDGIIGHSLAEHAGESIGLGLATEKFGASFFGNGSMFGGTVEIEGKLDEPAKDNVRKMIEAVHQGVERAHKILVLANGAKFKERGTSPNEAQFLETRKFQINEVARWLSMPPHKLGDLENAHFTNIEEQDYVGCVSGWLKMWEQELTRKLISPLEYSQQSIEHVLEGVLRGDSTKRAEFYSKMHSLGAFSINDILRLENKNTIGPAGDGHFVPLNMVPVERYKEYFEKKLLGEGEPQPVPKRRGRSRAQATGSAGSTRCG
jgi:HK97 family phage portal protein